MKRWSLRLVNLTTLAAFLLANAAVAGHPHQSADVCRCGSHTSRHPFLPTCRKTLANPAAANEKRVLLERNRVRNTKADARAARATAVAFRAPARMSARRAWR